MGRKIFMAAAIAAALPLAVASQASAQQGFGAPRSVYQEGYRLPPAPQQQFRGPNYQAVDPLSPSFRYRVYRTPPGLPAYGRSFYREPYGPHHLRPTAPTGIGARPSSFFRR